MTLRALSFFCTLAAVAWPGSGDAMPRPRGGCFFDLAGYHKQTKTLWMRHVCQRRGGATALYKRKLGGLGGAWEPVPVVREKDDPVLIKGPRRKADGASLKGALSLVEVPAQAFHFAPDSATSEYQVVGGLLKGDTAVSRRLGIPAGGKAIVVHRAFEIPDSTLGIVELRYTTKYESRFHQRYALYETRSRPVGALEDVELRVGPDYLALVTGTGKRAHLQLPEGCSLGGSKGRSFKSFPFMIPCKTGKALSVRRNKSELFLRRAREEGRMFLPHEKSEVVIRAEEVLASAKDGKDGLRRLVCTYGGRCSVLRGNRVETALSGPARPLCDPATCILVPKRRRQRDSFRYSIDTTKSWIIGVRLPELNKGERIVSVERNGVRISNRKGLERTATFGGGGQ
jgi:hypothetical protein